MADHLLYTPVQAATATLAGVRYQSTLARVVSQNFSSEFTPGRGSTVAIKRPIMIDPARVYTKANRAANDAITYSTLYQPYTSITLSDQVYNAVKLPDDFTTFTLQDLSTQVIAPMAQSVAEHLNTIVVDAFKGVSAGLSALDKAAKGKWVSTDGKTYNDEAAFLAAGKTQADFLGVGAGVTTKAAQLSATSLDDVLPVIRAAYQLLGQRGVPAGGRYLAVGANWETALLSLDNLNKVNEAGTDGQLREATIGKLYGFTIIADYSLDPNDAFAFDSNGIALATRTTATPRGVAFSQTVAQNGFALRYLQDYDPDHLTDRAVIDTFAGASVIDPQRIVRLTGADTIVAPKPATSAQAA